MRIIAQATTGIGDSLREVELEPGARFRQKPRRFVGGLWQAASTEPWREHHVLIIEDTWTTGAHAQSAAAALHDAGAAAVTIVALARWIDPEWSPTKVFMNDLLRNNFDVLDCPVSPGGCFAGASGV